jgi:hypothetical protein
VTRTARGAVAGLLVLMVAACAPTTTPSLSPVPTTSPSAASQSSDSPFPTSPLDGVVIDVSQTSLVDVLAFEIRTADGREFEFKVGELDNVAEFPPSHLAEHMADSVPIRVEFHVENNELIATHLDDAPAP